MKLYHFLFEQAATGNPYIGGFEIKTAEEFAREESSPDEFTSTKAAQSLAEKYSVGNLVDFLFEVSKVNVRKAVAPLPGSPDMKGRRIPTGDLKTFIGNVAKGETTELEDKTTPAMHSITAQNLLIPVTTLARKKAERDQVFKKGIEEKGLKVASEEAVNNLIKKLTDYSGLEILSQNGKMKKSGSEVGMYYNFSLPALRGLVYDEKASTPEEPVFLEVTTCPGAGKCMLGCFARGGSFVQYNAVSERQTKILNFLYNRPMELKQKLIDDIGMLTNKNKKKGIKTSIRWHDSGDFMSEGVTNLYYDVMRHFESEPMVDFYAYTKSIEMMKAHEEQGKVPSNFTHNYSYGATGKGEKAIDPTKDKFSEIVPENVVLRFLERVPVIDEKTGVAKVAKGKPVTKFAIKDGKDDEVKNAVKGSDVYKENGLPLITIPEYLEGDFSKPANVIILPGEPDTPANDKNIIGIYLIEH
jgi:hypothetical protein